jgi:cytochrome c oxidase subunit 2
VKLQNGETVLMDDNYIRESILNPGSKVVEGFQPVMPTFQGLVNEEGLAQIIAYIKSLGPKPGSQPGESAPARVSRSGVGSQPNR